MARRRVYTGCYTNHTRTTKSSRRNQSFAKSVKYKLFSAFYFLMDYYVLFCTIFFVLVVSFILPDLVNKINTSKEFKSMKKSVNKVVQEVNRAEVACITAADEIRYLHCSMRDCTTETVKDLQDISMCTSRCSSSTRSEPVQVEKKIGFFRRIFFPNRNATRNEIAIMSYVYTNSFDALKTNITESI